MVADRRTAKIDPDNLRLIFQRVQEKVLRRTEDEKHAADRHQRRAVDALRSRIKHLEPAVRVSDTWDQVKSRVEKLEEYRALDSDELRRTAFDKVIRRLKEKDEDMEKERELRDRDRDRDRDRRRGDHYDRSDRDHRNGYSSYRGDRKAPASRPSRTPEPDAYEADRRKAMADREKSYRKASGLSPAPSSHGTRGGRHDDRDRDRERDKERDSRHPHYDRERRDREEERERLYRTRGDPRGSRDELDYGGEGPRSTSRTGGSERRRRRESDGESVGSRGAKRYRRDVRERERSAEVSGRGSGGRRDRERDRERSTRDKDRARDSDRGRTPDKAAIEAQKKKDEEKALHSGSEEGEIEED
jgi:pre-mRNA-processing factor 40